VQDDLDELLQVRGGFAGEAWGVGCPRGRRAAAAVGAAVGCAAARRPRLRTSPPHAHSAHLLPHPRQVLPPRLSGALASHPRRGELIEVVLDLGRRPEARFQGGSYEYLGPDAVGGVGGWGGVLDA
jgi:hypothetical protein